MPLLGSKFCAAPLECATSDLQTPEKASGHCTWLSPGPPAAPSGVGDCVGLAVSQGVAPTHASLSHTISSFPTRLVPVLCLVQENLEQVSSALRLRHFCPITVAVSVIVTDHGYPWL